MSNFIVSRFGQINAAGATDALFLKVFAGEVLTTFEQENVMLARTMVKTISSGKSAQFPVTGIVTGGYHVVGEEISGQATKQNEKVISIDELLVSSVFLASIEEAKNHWDARAIYTTECGRFLANTLDTKLLQVAILAARASATITTTGYGGSQVATASMDTDKAVLKAGFLTAAKTLDTKNVPSADRHAILKPAQYYLLLTDSEIISRDYDVAGSVRKGTVHEYMGFQIAKSNHVPSTTVSAATGENNTYSGAFGSSVASLFQKGAVGTVKLMDLSTEMEKSVRHQGTLVVAKYAMGHGILRPECAVELCVP